jgi:hypothetical protein
MKFYIRDLFLVTLIVSLGLGWWIDHATLTAKQAARDAAWEKAFESLAIQLTAPRGDSPPDEISVETPNGPWRIAEEQHRIIPPEAPR